MAGGDGLWAVGRVVAILCGLILSVTVALDQVRRHQQHHDHPDGKQEVGGPVWPASSPAPWDHHLAQIAQRKVSTQLGCRRADHSPLESACPQHFVRLALMPCAVGCLHFQHIRPTIVRRTPVSVARDAELGSREREAIEDKRRRHARGPRSEVAPDAVLVPAPCL